MSATPQPIIRGRNCKRPKNGLCANWRRCNSRIRPAKPQHEHLHEVAREWHVAGSRELEHAKIAKIEAKARDLRHGAAQT